MSHPSGRTSRFILVGILLTAAMTTAQSGSRKPSSIDLSRTKVVTPPADTELFLPVTTYDSGGQTASAMALVDVNGDHKMDIIVVNSGPDSLGNSTVGVLLGNGDGTFQPAVAYDTGDPRSSTLAVGDINGDGKLDVVVGNAGDANSVSALLGNGDGTFQPAVVYSTGTAYINGTMPITIADLNGDGYGDVVALTQSSISTLLGTANGTLQSAVGSFTSDVPLTTLALVDLNHDSILDAVTLNCDDYCVGAEADFWVGTGEGTFAEVNRLGGGGGNSQAAIVVADVNGDGIPDLVFGDGGMGGGGSVSVLIGRGDGTFNPEVNYPFPRSGGITSMVVTDLNGDGKLDIAAAGATVTILINQGDGTFQVKQTYPSTAASVIKVADLNHDKKMDLLLLEPQSGNQFVVEALLGNGDGTFSGGGFLFASGGYPSDLAVIDLNGDGRPDVLVANACSTCSPNIQEGSIGVLLNNKHFVFSHTKTALTSSPNPSVYGQNVTFTAVVTANSGSATGTVTFLNAQGSNFMGSSNLVNGTATLTGAFFGAGSNSAVAIYQGTENFTGSTSNTANQVVNPATTTTSLISSPNPARVGQTVTYSPTVHSQFGGTASGTITLYDGATTIGVLTLGPNQKTSIKEKYAVPGTHSITATYSGDGSNIGSTSSPLSEQVQAQTTTVLTTSGSPSHVGQLVTFTANVTSAFGAIPDGEIVTFSDNGKAIGLVPLSGGVATYATAALKTKTHTIKAVYPGDSTFQTSHGTVVQVVEP
jgi:Bacterial Ig-like domain (group 3)/FG-GAP-like repeat